MSEIADDWRRLILTGDEDLRRLLSEARSIAVLGMKEEPAEVSYRIPAYMAERGYTILPVNPTAATIMGRRAYASLADIAERVDIVDVFRHPRFIPGHAEEALKLRPGAFWMQSGIRDAAAAEKLARAGIAVVEDRCLMVEHARLLGR